MHVVKAKAQAREMATVSANLEYRQRRLEYRIGPEMAAPAYFSIDLAIKLYCKCQQLRLM